MPDNDRAPRFLDACELLTRRVDCESVYFTQLLDLVREAEPGRYVPVVHPADLAYVIAEFEDRLPAALAKAQAIKGLMRADGEVAPRKHRAAVRRIEALHRRPAQSQKKGGKNAEKAANASPASRYALSPDRLAELVRGRGAEKPSEADRPAPARIGYGTLGAVRDASREMLELLEKLRQAAKPDAQRRPTLAIGVRYRQQWCSLGYNRGDLIRSIPLAADARKEIVVKTWRTRKERREENESVEENISNEFVGDEKWSLAVQKQTSAELNQSLDARLKASGDVTVPVKKVPVKLGAEGGGESSTDVKLKRTVTETEEAIKNTTVKAANSLKSQVSSTVETSEERGFESTVTDTLVNPNKCHSLTYHFFEIVESFRVKTEVEEVVPYVMLPLPYPTVTKEWLLCHECLLRKHLPCSTLYSGFEAAKRVLANERLGLFTARGDEGDGQVDALLKLIEDLLGAYDGLRSASLLPGLPAPEEEGGDFMEGVENTIGWWVDVGEGIVDAGKGLLEQGAEVVGDVVDGVGDIVEDVGEAVEEIVEGVEEGIETVSTMASDAWSAVTSPFQVQFSMAPGASAGGGPGSFIYHEVAKVAAPEVLAALAGLESAYQTIREMPEGPARAQAILTALDGFFATIGDVEEAFRKIDIGLLVALISAVGVAGVSAGLLAALTTTLVVGTGGAALALAAGLGLAAAAGMSGAALTTALAGFGLEHIDHADLFPDDLGLKAGIHGLYALYRQLGQAIGLPVMPPDPTPEQVAAYERERRERDQERRELAEAQVDLERLICHVRSNLAHYFQVIAAAMPVAEVARVVEGFHIPLHAVELRFEHFLGNRVGLRVLDARWLRLSGLDLEAELKALRQSGLGAQGESEVEIVLPTRGMLVEPRLGECDACDAFIQAHREKDLAMKDAELAQARFESARLQKRLSAGLLGDPTPYEPASSVSVDVTEDRDDG